jgi:hypothetical protein
VTFDPEKGMIPLECCDEDTKCYVDEGKGLFWGCNKKRAGDGDEVALLHPGLDLV